jgi:signal transduction histidine kinase
MPATPPREPPPAAGPGGTGADALDPVRDVGSGEGGAAGRGRRDGHPGELSPERVRIAGELNDIVAHAVTALAVCAGAAERQLRDDTGPARDSLRAVRSIAGEAMADLRRMQAVLHQGPPAYAPQPGLGELPELAARARRRGAGVTLDVVGDAGSVRDSVAVTVHRIVEAALREAGPADPATRVSVAVSPVAVVLRVSPSRPGALDDAGDRVRLHGGRLVRERGGDLVVTLPSRPGR